MVTNPSEQARENRLSGLEAYDQTGFHGDQQMILWFIWASRSLTTLEVMFRLRICRIVLRALKKKPLVGKIADGGKSCRLRSIGIQSLSEDYCTATLLSAKEV